MNYTSYLQIVFLSAPYTLSLWLVAGFGRESSVYLAFLHVVFFYIVVSSSVRRMSVYFYVFNGIFRSGKPGCILQCQHFYFEIYSVSWRNFRVYFYLFGNFLFTSKYFELPKVQFSSYFLCTRLPKCCRHVLLIYPRFVDFIQSAFMFVFPLRASCLGQPLYVSRRSKKSGSVALLGLVTTVNEFKRWKECPRQNF